MATGDTRIDALLEPGRISLAYNHQPGTGAVISYSFLRQGPSDYAVDDFRMLDADGNFQPDRCDLSSNRAGRAAAVRPL